jgi:hypothetical protein
MADWTSSMQQTYEYYTVNPDTWGNAQLLKTVKTSSMNRDSEAETLGSASIDITDALGEVYVRGYLKTVQNDITEMHPLGTYLVQTPSMSFDGKVQSYSGDAYTPLIELKEKQPPIGYFIPKNANAIEEAYKIIRENARAPVVKPIILNDKKYKLSYDFVADTSDTWLSFLNDLLADVQYSLDLDEMGRIFFAKVQTVTAMQPVWTYTDDNSSILYPELSLDRDLYGIPNAIEVVYSKTDAVNDLKPAIARNEDPQSPVSIPSRGREIWYRVLDPELLNPTQEQLDEYAKQVLEELSSIEYTVSYTHGYCPVRVGDCVRLNYARAGLNNVKAKVIKQNINCTSGCPVSETAIFTAKLWEGKVS